MLLRYFATGSSCFQLVYLSGMKFQYHPSAASLKINWIICTNDTHDRVSIDSSDRPAIDMSVAARSTDT